MAVRRFLIFGQADLNALSEVSCSLVTAWAKRWLIDGEKDVCIDRTEDASGQVLLPSTGSAEHSLVFAVQERQAYFVVNDDVVGLLCDSVLGPEGRGQRVVRAHWREQELALAGDVLGSLAQGLLGQEGTLGYADRLVDVSPSELPSGSGWLNLVIAIKSQSLVVVLSQEAVMALRATVISDKVRSSRLIARSAVLVRGDMRVEALAGEANISLRELFELRPGQVVRLDTHFREPLRLLSKTSGKAIAKAWLGSSGSKKALQINAE